MKTLLKNHNSKMQTLILVMVPGQQAELRSDGAQNGEPLAMGARGCLDSGLPAR